MGRKITIILLLIITGCLVAITGRIYSVSLTLEAQAVQSGVVRSKTETTTLKLYEGSFIPVAIYAQNYNGSWSPCRINQWGQLMIQRE